VKKVKAAIKREQNQACLSYAEREQVLRPEGAKCGVAMSRGDKGEKINCRNEIFLVFSVGIFA